MIASLLGVPAQLTLDCPGDESQKPHYEDLAASYNPEPYWSEIHPRLLTTIQYEQLKPPTPLPPSKKGTTIVPTGNQNRSSTLRSKPQNARGPDEPVDEYLSRLPPSTTKNDSIGPWIFVSDPRQRAIMEDAQDEDLPTLITKGRDLLHEFENKKTTMEAEHDRSGAETKAPLTRKLNILRHSLEDDIFSLAQETNITTGKWMLFRSVERVDMTWAAVVGTTVRGELGIGAKVATDSQNEKSKARLICIYTRDCEDLEDVRRVVEKLVELELVTEKARPIYYKADAYTYLDISSGNPYGLKASLFSSKDVLEGKV